MVGWGETRRQGRKDPRPHRAGFTHWAELVQWAELPSELAQKWKLGSAQHIAPARPATSVVTGEVNSVVMLRGSGVGVRRGGGEQGIIGAVRVEPRYIVVIVAEDRRRVGCRAKPH